MMRLRKSTMCRSDVMREATAGAKRSSRFKASPMISNSRSTARRNQRSAGYCSNVCPAPQRRDAGGNGGSQTIEPVQSFSDDLKLTFHRAAEPAVGGVLFKRVSGA